MPQTFVSQLLQEIAPEIDATVELDRDFGAVGEIIFSNGKRHLFSNTNFNVNSAAAVEIAKDKGCTKYFLSKHGVSVPKGKTFFADRLLPKLKKYSEFRDLDRACTYANSLGFPVFIKPNNLSQGILVCKVYNENELRKVANKIFQIADVALIEAACIGRDYRIIVFEDKIIAAYERCPLTIIGDGRSTIEELLIQKLKTLPSQNSPDKETDFNDFSIWNKLEREGFQSSTVLAPGYLILVLDNANLSSGGNAIDITETLHTSCRDLAISAARILGLHLCGVDIICANAEAELLEYWILEVNGAPGLDNYASIGSKQSQRVRSLYKSILQHLERV
jgi:D-alanine-D-alanine ligase-like ATP-grasp enzyme